MLSIFKRKLFARAIETSLILFITLGLTACGGETDSPDNKTVDDAVDNGVDDNTADDNNDPEPQKTDNDADTDTATDTDTKTDPTPKPANGFVCVEPAEGDMEKATDGVFTIHYLRHSGEYNDWCLHLWDRALPAGIGTSWKNPRAFDEVVNGWSIARLPVGNAAENLSFIVHKGETKSPDNDLGATPAVDGFNVWLVQDINEVFFSEEDALAAVGDIGNTSAQLDLSDVTVLDTDSGLGEDWNETATFIEIYVRSYADSDGDGVGDINGVTAKLDYLQQLGINGIWLMPVTESSDNDHGYAVADYRDIEDDYGTMADFENLLAQAHARGIGIIMDYVINHASSVNPLFKDAASSVSNSKRDWFLWEEEAPEGWHVMGGNPWHSLETGAYYGAFHSSMPDFNLANPEVIAFHHNNLKFWLNKGVDGFRFDAVGMLFETDAHNFENQEANHPFMKDVAELVHSYNNRYVVCEAPTGAKAFAAPTSCGKAFAFGAQNGFGASPEYNMVLRAIVDWMSNENFDDTPLVLSNHDSFAGERPYDRMDANETWMKLAAGSYLLASPTPFIYYGEEIGMSRANIAHGDKSLRAPMSWTGDEDTAGFTEGTPYRQLAENVATHNVEAAQANADSLYWYYKNAIDVRRQYPVLQLGELNLQSVKNDPALIFTRSTETAVAAVIVNYTEESVNVNVETGVARADFNEVYAAGSSESSDNAGLLSVSVPAQSIRVFYHQK